MKPSSAPVSLPISHRWFRECAILFGVGMLIGALGDSLHVQSGIESYPPGSKTLPGLGIPFWVLLEFAGVGVTAGQLHLLVLRWAVCTLHRRAPLPASLGRSIAGIAALLCFWIASGYLPLPTGGAKDALLWIGGFSLWGWLDRSAIGFGLGLITGVMGLSTEIFLIQQGVFSYSAEAANCGGAASWLIPLYFSASMAISTLARFVRYGDRPIV